MVIVKHSLPTTITKKRKVGGSCWLPHCLSTIFDWFRDFLELSLSSAALGLTLKNQKNGFKVVVEHNKNIYFGIHDKRNRHRPNFRITRERKPNLIDFYYREKCELGRQVLK